MSLLAGIKFVKKATSASVETAAKSEDLEGGGTRPEDHEKNRRKRKEHKKDRKEKSRAHRDKTTDEGKASEQPSSKRRKSKDSMVESEGGRSMAGNGGSDWLDEALNVDASKFNSKGKHANMEVDDEVLEGRQGHKSKPRYGLYDPRQVDDGKASAGGMGLESMVAPRLVPGIGDKGAGWRAKALKRARERAEQSGKSFQEVVQERWGSVDQLKRETRTAADQGLGHKRGRGRGYEFHRGRDELRALSASDGRIPPGDAMQQVGQREGGLGSNGDIRGGRGSRLRIGRDAKDTDVIRRFSSKLEDALGRNKETSRHRDEGRDERVRDSERDDESRDRRSTVNALEGRMGWREREARATGHGDERKRDEDVRRRGREQESRRMDRGSHPNRDRSRERYENKRVQSRDQREQREQRASSDKSQSQDHKVWSGRRDSHHRSLDSHGSHRGTTSEQRDLAKNPDGSPDAAESRTAGSEEASNTRVRDHSDAEDRSQDGEIPLDDFDDAGRRGDNEEKKDNGDTRVMMGGDGGKTDVKLGLEERSERKAGFEREAHSGTATVKALSEAEITKLTVAAMKAKLKGDKATYERLMGQARAGREAGAKAPSPVRANPSETDVKMAPDAKSAKPSNPGQIEDQGKRGGRSTRSEGHDGESPRKTGDRQGRDQHQPGEDGEETEVITFTDERGRPIHGISAKAPLMREDLRQGARKGKLKAVGGRWAENEGESVADFVRREREQGFEDMDETFLRNVSRLGSKFKGTELGGAPSGQADEDEDVDMRMFQRPEDRMTAVAAAERQRSRAIREHVRRSGMTSRCHLCLDSPVFKKHLMLSLGEHTFLYLATDPHRLSDGHCYIVPIRHTPASTACDEDVWREIDLFKAGLRRMASSAEAGPKDRRADETSSMSRRKADGAGGVIFLETGGKDGSSAAKHAFIEAVPVNKNAFLDAPLYFRQAIMEAGEEWSTHKKCIAADPKRGGIRRAVPKGFPYFHVEWDDGGYAHVIEGEESKFPRNFGVDTLAGVLGVEPPRFGGRDRAGGGRGAGRGARQEEAERKMVLSFLERWKAFDWTSQLDAFMVGLITQYPVSLVANTDGMNSGGHPVPRRRRRLRDAVLDGFESIHRNRLICASTATEMTSSINHRASHHVVWMPQHDSSGEARLVTFHDEAYGDSFAGNLEDEACGAGLFSPPVRLVRLLLEHLPPPKSPPLAVRAVLTAPGGRYHPTTHPARLQEGREGYYWGNESVFFNDLRRENDEEEDSRTAREASRRNYDAGRCDRGSLQGAPETEDYYGEIKSERGADREREVAVVWWLTGEHRSWMGMSSKRRKGCTRAAAEALGCNVAGVQGVTEDLGGNRSRIPALHICEGRPYTANRLCRYPNVATSTRPFQAVHSYRVPTAQWGQKDKHDHDHDGSATSSRYRERDREDCTGEALARELVPSGDEDEDEDKDKDEVSIIDVKPSHWYNVRQRFSWQGGGTSSSILDEVVTGTTCVHTEPVPPKAPPRPRGILGCIIPQESRTLRFFFRLRWEGSQGHRCGLGHGALRQEYFLQERAFLSDVSRGERGDDHVGVIGAVKGVEQVGQSGRKERGTGQRANENHRIHKDAGYPGARETRREDRRDARHSAHGSWVTETDVGSRGDRQDGGRGDDTCSGVTVRETDSFVKQAQNMPPGGPSDVMGHWSKWKTICKTRQISETVELRRDGPCTPRGLEYRVAMRFRAGGKTQLATSETLKVPHELLDRLYEIEKLDLGSMSSEYIPGAVNATWGARGDCEEAREPLSPLERFESIDGRAADNLAARMASRLQSAFWSQEPKERSHGTVKDPRIIAEATSIQRDVQFPINLRVIVGIIREMENCQGLEIASSEKGTNCSTEVKTWFQEFV